MAKARLTKAGAILLAKAIAGTQLTFTRGAFGDAAGSSAPTDSQIDNLTALLHEKMSLPIANFQIKNNQAVVTLTVKNEDVTAGFRVAEGGLFARNADNAQEVLYAYFYDGNDGDYMPAGDADVQLEYAYEFITAVANAANVTAIIDKSTVGIMRDEFEAHIASSLPHPNWDVILRPEFNAHSLSANPHPNWRVQIYPGVGLTKSGDTINVVTASAQSLGGIKVGRNLYMDGESLNASGEEGTDARLRQLEINQANLFMLLEAANKFGVQSNLMLVEDFKTLKATRFVELDATISNKNDTFFSADSISSFRSSNYCVITDGLLFNKFVQITAIEKDDGTYTASVDSALKEDTAHAKVYRSTVNIKDGKAYGSGWVKYNRQRASRTWKGEGYSDTTQITFNAYPSLESSLGLDGDWSLTADGYFTLD